MATNQKWTRSVLITGFILGVGLIGALDEIVLHQLLQWHNFYVHTTEFWRIFIDGVFHFTTTLLAAWGAARIWQNRRYYTPIDRRVLIAGILLGMGAFNLWDGTIQHKVLNLHQVREGVTNIAPYDIVFIGVALLLLLTGWLLWRRTMNMPERMSSTQVSAPDD
jgi:uncharacterized membrane protein